MAEETEEMDDDLVAELKVLELDDEGLKQKLQIIGVQTKEDINCVTEVDLTRAGFTLVQSRKVMSITTTDVESVASLPPFESSLSLGSMPARQGSGVPFYISAADSDEEAPVEASIGTTSFSPHALTEKTSSRLSTDGRHITVPRNIRAASRDKRRTSTFWQTQQQGRPMRVIFIRHGESEANVNRALTMVVPDHALHLTEKGRKQALGAGLRLRSIVRDDSVKYIVSPYVRTKETLNGIIHAWDPSEWQKGWIREDVRIREQEFGNYDSPDMARLHATKKQFGPFYYRFPEGESIADCYDRASLFVESIYRSWHDNTKTNEVIVGHGTMILVTLMRLLRLTVDDFGNLDHLQNCEFVVLERPPDEPLFHISYTWCEDQPKVTEGLRRLSPSNQRQKQQIWNGDPDDPLLTSQAALE